MTQESQPPKVLVYEENVSSIKTELLFLSLTAFFLLLFIWRLNAYGLNAMTILFICFFCFFLFYSVNYRILTIRLYTDSLILLFGVFSWPISLDNIENCLLDDLPEIKRMGGAGIHFMFVRKRYRVSFNFLEYPRVVILLKNKMGLVWDVSFSTLHPEKVISLIMNPYHN